MVNGRFSADQAVRFIETGKLGPAKQESLEYSAEVMEMTAKALDKAYGG